MIKIKKIKSFYPTKKERNIKLTYSDPASYWDFEPVKKYRFNSNTSPEDLETIQRLKRARKKNINLVNTLAKKHRDIEKPAKRWTERIRFI